MSVPGRWIMSTQHPHFRLQCGQLGQWEQLSLVCCVCPGPGKCLQPFSFPTEVTQLALSAGFSLSSLLGSPTASPEQIPPSARSWA